MVKPSPEVQALIRSLERFIADEEECIKRLESRLAAERNCLANAVLRVRLLKLCTTLSDES